MDFIPDDLPLFVLLVCAVLCAAAFPRLSVGAFLFVTLLLSAIVGVACLIGGAL